ncbi:MAG TPA: hypothetical protein PKV67_12605 [Hyphomonas sp.]|nr:hypothetical protein [Hyphomonas sp.]
MKPVTAILFLSLAAVGTACSDAGTAKVASKEATVETASAETEVKGKLNLNIGRPAEDRGGLIVSGNTGNSNGLLISPSSGGGNIKDVEGLDVQIVESPDDLLKAPEKSDEDEIIRLPE